METGTEISLILNIGQLIHLLYVSNAQYFSRVQNEVSYKTEAFKSKMISEEKVNVLKQELDAVQEMMVQCKNDYERIKRQIHQQVQNTQRDAGWG